MLYLLGHHGYETWENLSQKLYEIIGEDNFKSVTRVGKIKNIKKKDILVRWGTTKNSEFDNYFVSLGGTVLNSARSIMLNTNKLKSLSMFKQNGLLTPVVYNSKYDIKKFPVLGRDKNHTGGKDIVIINGNNILRHNNFDEIPNKDFYVEVIQSREEYRVHVFKDKVIRVTQKVFRGHDRDGNFITKKSFIRNDTYGYGMSHVDTEYFDKGFSQAAIKAVKSIGLDFGAVDMIISNDGNPYILEVNSCPRLNSIGLEIYVDELNELYKTNCGLFKKYFWN